MITDTMRALLGQRVQLIDVPLRLQNTPPVPPGTFMEAWGVDGELTAVERAAIRRDLHCCRACGFVSEEHQRAVALNGNRRDLDQTVTLCLFCHQCFHLDKVAGMESGVLIHLPELTQAELHHVARELYVGRVLGGETAAAAQACLDALLARRAQARERIGSDDPAALAERLAAVDDPAALDAELDGIRLLPLDRRLVRKGNMLENLFPPILAYFVMDERLYRIAGLTDLPWFRWASGLLGFGQIELVPTLKQLCASIHENPFNQEGVREQDALEYEIRMDSHDPFYYRILKRMPDSDQSQEVIRYRVLDTSEQPNITRERLENLLYMLGGLEYRMHDFKEKTNTRMLFQVGSPNDDGWVECLFSAYDGNVLTGNARMVVDTKQISLQTRSDGLCASQ